MESPLLSVKEICRATNLPPTVVVNYLLLPGAIVFPEGLVGQTLKDWQREQKIPQSSKMANRIRAQIWNESQRYERKFQFPSGNTPKTTERKARARIIDYQLNNVRLALKAESDETPKNSKREKVYYPRYLSKELSLAEQRVQELLTELNKNSVMSMQRLGRIKELLLQGALLGEPFLLVNWICPAGTPLALAPDNSGLFRSYVRIDPEEALKKDYRLVPRLDQERILVDSFEKAAIPLFYLKLVADDNAYCLYPFSIDKDGEQPTKDAMKNYSCCAQNLMDREIGKDRVTVLTVSDFLGPEGFERLIRLFRDTRIEELLPFLPKDIFPIEKDVITKHTKLSADLLPYLDRFVEAVIRQYAVEGLIIAETLSDNVVVAWNESTRRFATIDAGRKAQDLPAFPKIFVLYEKRDGQIINNY